MASASGGLTASGELKRFGELVKKELNEERAIPLRESVRHDCEEIIRVIEEEGREEHG